VARLPGVECRRGNAFAIRPETEGPFDWIVCDVVAYPEKLWEWISLWLHSGAARNLVCTVKFQGRDHYGAVSAFESVPGSRLEHLSVNKHELTWMWPLTPSKPEPAPGR
jgi:23S rRNA (cytidine2498-2'-O)-methyltransferase